MNIRGKVERLEHRLVPRKVTDEEIAAMTDAELEELAQIGPEELRALFKSFTDDELRAIAAGRASAHLLEMLAQAFRHRK
jgi:hypothetical protein